jgi:hypothetical protein
MKAIMVFAFASLLGGCVTNSSGSTGGIASAPQMRICQGCEDGGSDGQDAASRRFPDYQLSAAISRHVTRAPIGGSRHIPQDAFQRGCVEQPYR